MLIDSTCIDITQTYPIKIKASSNNNTPNATLQPWYDKGIAIFFSFKFAFLICYFAFLICYFKVTFIKENNLLLLFESNSLLTLIL